MAAVVDDALTVIIERGGLLGALLVVSGTLNIFQFKKNSKLQDDKVLLVEKRAEVIQTIKDEDFKILEAMREKQQERDEKHREGMVAVLNIVKNIEDYITRRKV